MKVRQILNELKDLPFITLFGRKADEISYHDIVNHAIEHNFLRKTKGN